MVQNLELADGGTVLFDDAFLDPDAADALLRLLLEQTTWKQEVGRGRPFPRLTAWYADAGLVYSYSGVTHHGAGWTPTLLDLKQRIEAVAAADFNSLLINLYRDGQDSIGFHADDEPELGVNPVIASLTLGEARDFVLKHTKTKEKRTFPLGNGCLLIMGGTCQHHWLHAVPKTLRTVGQRINLTWRKIFPAVVLDKAR
jgi:alkylated DNA repair dioxygenase AlkB